MNEWMNETPRESSVCQYLYLRARSLSLFSSPLVRIARRAFLTFSVHNASQLEFSLILSSPSPVLYCLSRQYVRALNFLRQTTLLDSLLNVESRSRAEWKKEKRRRRRKKELNVREKETIGNARPERLFLVQCSITISSGLAITMTRQMINYWIESFNDQHSFSSPFSRCVNRNQSIKVRWDALIY